MRISDWSSDVCSSDLVNLKLDFRLIAAAAARRPALQWVFIGATGIGTTYSFDARPDVNAEWEQLNSLGNVHFLGVKDRSEIPVYLNGCDVLSLPLSTSFVGFQIGRASCRDRVCQYV